MTGPAAIGIDSVAKHYATPAGLVRALEDVSFDVPAGTSVAITGPSGCGKSTLLGLIAGLEVPTSGRVSVGAEEISRLPDGRRARLRRDQLGLVFQADNLLPFLTAVENVSLQLALHAAGERDEPRFERSLELLGDLGLAADAEKLPDQLAGGQRQRVAIARALVHRPRVLLADEPTGALDAKSSAAVIDLLLAAQRESGVTLVVVTHDLEVAGRMDLAVRLRDGRLDA